MELIKAENIVLSYDGNVVIDGLSFSVRSGDYVAVVGENGSGKSTLMKAITGEIRPVSGNLVLCDEIKKYGVGYLPQQSAIQRDFPASVYEAVLSGNIRRNSFGFSWSGESKDRADEFIHLLGICRLCGEHGDEYEVFCMDRGDEGILMKFFRELQADSTSAA